MRGQNRERNTGITVGMGEAELVTPSANGVNVYKDDGTVLSLGY